MNTDKILEVLTAFKKGKQIQWKEKKEIDWNDLVEGTYLDTDWDFQMYDYRVKPNDETKKTKEVYKIRHKPTGYFIQPSNASNHWSTLGKKGKIYEGNNMWTKVQNGSEYYSVEVHQGYNIFDELSKRFPDRVDISRCHYNIGRIRFLTKPEDFEKVLLN